eukprot:200829-Chlamydomonas_euryale.AAC.2
MRSHQGHHTEVITPRCPAHLQVSFTMAEQVLSHVWLLSCDIWLLLRRQWSARMRAAIRRTLHNGPANARPGPQKAQRRTWSTARQAKGEKKVLHTRLCGRTRSKAAVVTTTKFVARTTPELGVPAAV